MSETGFGAPFDPATADANWQARWDAAQTFRADSDSDKPKSYVLEMFPYPSGRIHIGHVRNYTMGDVLARYKKAIGHEVPRPAADRARPTRLAAQRGQQVMEQVKPEEIQNLAQSMLSNQDTVSSLQSLLSGSLFSGK